MMGVTIGGGNMDTANIFIKPVASSVSEVIGGWLRVNFDNQIHQFWGSGYVIFDKKSGFPHAKFPNQESYFLGNSTNYASSAWHTTTHAQEISSDLMRSSYLSTKILYMSDHTYNYIQKSNGLYSIKVGQNTSGYKGAIFIPVNRMNGKELQVHVTSSSSNPIHIGVTGVDDEGHTLTPEANPGDMVYWYASYDNSEGVKKFNITNVPYFDYVLIWSEASAITVDNITVKKKFRTTSIYSYLYPNANVYSAGTVSVNNGNRNPVTKANNGDAVVFCVRNGSGDEYGGNWLVTICIALSSEAALLTAPNISAGTTPYTINGITYYVGGQGTNASWGGATTISSPIGVPIFDDWFMWRPNYSMSEATLIEILQRLQIYPYNSGGTGN